VASHFDPVALPDEVRSFLAERHLATLTTTRADGSPHVVPVGFGYDEAVGIARVITFAPAVKARNAARGGRGALCQVDGGRWLTLEGALRLVTRADDDAAVEAALAAYRARYREPKARPDRVAIELRVDRIMGRA
jgi:PPOX class probable F420-dependent enzyme